MRWKAIFILIPLLLLLGLGYYFLLDLILAKSIAGALETITGAKVDVEKLHFSITTPALSIGRLQVANPRNTWHNLIEIRDIRFKLAWEPLFSGKFVINKITLSELMINSPRQTDGKLKRRPLPGPYGKARTKLNRAIADIPLLNSGIMLDEINKNIGKLLADYKFQTHREAEAVKNKLAETAIRWNHNLEKLQELQVKLEDIERQLGELKLNQLKTLPQLNAALTSINALKKATIDIQAEISTVGTGFQNELAGLNHEIKRLSATAGADYQALLKLAKIPDFNKINLTEILLGKFLTGQLEFVTDLVDQVQAFLPLPIDNPPKKKQPRGGQDIIFPGRRTYPNFLIEYIEISVRNSGPATGGFKAAGTVTGITSDPPIYGRPMRIGLAATAPGNLTLALQGTIDHITPQIDDRFHLEIANLTIPEISFPDRPHLPRIQVGNTAVRSDLHITCRDFTLDLVINGKDITWDFGAVPASSGDLLADIIRQTLTGIDRLTVNYRLEGRDNQLALRISSNLDQVFNERLHQVIDEKFAKFKQTIKTHVDQQLREKQQELEQLKNNWQRQLSVKYQELQLLAQNQLRAIETKKNALEQQLKNELNQKITSETAKTKKETEEQLNKIKSQFPKY